MNREHITLAFLAVLTAIAPFFCYLLIAPFLKPIVFAAIVRTRDFAELEAESQLARQGK